MLDLGPSALDPRRSSIREPVQIALQEERGCGCVHFLFSLLAANVGFNERAVGLGRGQAFVPGSYRNGKLALESVHKLFHLHRGQTVVPSIFRGRPTKISSTSFSSSNS